MARDRHRDIKLLDLVRDRLHDWGTWRRSDITNIGYPSISAESRERLSPGICTKPSDGPNYKLATKEILETDSIIMSLRGYKGVALWCHYVQGMDKKRAAHVCDVASAYDYNLLLKLAEGEVAKAIRNHTNANS